uniref:Conserved protein n=1 Tax=Haptophyceae sp. NIES-3900 TaxID=2748608 RepID=A0A7R7AHN6_9EUKA|nr:conserved protein [Haptophyceae sp. NIES-3900]
MTIFIRITSLLSGYFLAVTLASVLTRNEQWILLIISSLVAFLESTGNIYYSSNLDTSMKRVKIFLSLNYLKIGVLYGLFMDAFKLGS